MSDVAANGVQARHSSETAEHGSPPRIVEAARVVLGGFDLDPASNAEWNKVIRAATYFEWTPEGGGFALSWFGRVWCNPPGGWQDKLGRRVVKASSNEGACEETGACDLPGVPRVPCPKCGAAAERPCTTPRGKVAKDYHQERCVAADHWHEGCDSSQREWWCKTYREWACGNAKAIAFLCFSVEALQTTQGIDGVLPMLAMPICYPSERLKYMKPDGTVGSSPPHSSCVVLLPERVECYGCGASIRWPERRCTCGEPASGDSTHPMVEKFVDEFCAIGKVVVPR